MASPRESLYKKRILSIGNIIRNHAKKLNISGIAITGSRARHKHTIHSDEDIIISAINDPSKQEFYPKLMKVLRKTFPDWRVYSGKSYNVIHLDDPIKGGDFELVLLTEAQFNDHHKKEILYRKKDI